MRAARGALPCCERGERAATGIWTLERLQVDVRAQYTVEDVLQLKGADANCVVHTRQVIETIGSWDEACLFLEDWDFFARCLLHDPPHVYWVPEILVEYRQVYGVDVDGLCAVTVQDPVRKRSRWQYIVEKWRSQPGFAGTAERLTAKYLGEIDSP